MATSGLRLCPAAPTVVSAARAAASMTNSSAVTRASCGRLIARCWRSRTKKTGVELSAHRRGEPPGATCSAEGGSTRLDLEQLGIHAPDDLGITGAGVVAYPYGPEGGARNQIGRTDTLNQCIKTLAPIISSGLQIACQTKGFATRFAAMGQPNRCNSFGKRIKMRDRLGHYSTLLVFVAPCLFVTTTANAASGEAQDRAARKACLTGDYAKGISILSDLFIKSKDATHLFNQGRCFEQNRRYEDAIARFEEFLRAATNQKVDEHSKTEAKKHIADCKDLLTQQTARSPAPAVSPPQPIVVQVAPALPTATSTPAAAPAIGEQVLPQPTTVPGSGLRTAGIITASVGGAAVIAGVILNLKVNSMASDMESPGGYSPSRESDRKSYKTLGWISYSVGAASIATGTVLYVLGLRASSASSASLTLLPAFAPSQAGMAVKGTF
jgi:hypothetical protein